MAEKTWTGPGLKPKVSGLMYQRSSHLSYPALWMVAVPNSQLFLAFHFTIKLFSPEAMVKLWCFINCGCDSQYTWNCRQIAFGCSPNLRRAAQRKIHGVASSEHAADGLSWIVTLSVPRWVSRMNFSSKGENLDDSDLSLLCAMLFLRQIRCWA